MCKLPGKNLDSILVIGGQAVFCQHAGDADTGTICRMTAAGLFWKHSISLSLQIARSLQITLVERLLSDT